MGKSSGNANVWLMFLGVFLIAFIIYSSYINWQNDEQQKSPSNHTEITTSPTPTINLNNPLTFLNQHGKANVLVTLSVEEDGEIKDAQEQVKEELMGQHVNIYFLSDITPEMAMTVDEKALVILIESTHVEKISPDNPNPGN